MRYDVESFHKETMRHLSSLDEKNDRILNLLDKHAKTHADLEHEFAIVQARLERVEEKLGLRNISL